MRQMPLMKKKTWVSISATTLHWSLGGQFNGETALFVFPTELTSHLAQYRGALFDIASPALSYPPTPGM